MDVNVIARTLNALFPKTVERLQELDRLKRKIERVERKYRMFGQTNFGCTGDQLRMAHFALAMEFENLRYWWMSPIKPMIIKGWRLTNKKPSIKIHK